MENSKSKEATHNRQSSYITVISGTIAGIVATVSKQPLERLKWLRQVSEGKSYLGHEKNYIKIGKHIITQEGFFGLFRGTTAGITRNIPHSVLVYTTYPKVNSILLSHFPSFKKNKLLSHTLTGSISSMLCTIITHPLDTIRVRIAVQFDSIRYNSYKELLKETYNNEGLLALYKGFLATTLGVAIRGGVGFGIYETLKSESLKNWSNNSPILNRFGIGMIAGFFSTITCYPIDTVRRRIQVWGTDRLLTNEELKVFGGQHEPDMKTARGLFIHIIKYDGILGLYKGLGITLIKTPLATAISLTINDVVKKCFGWHA